MNSQDQKSSAFGASETKYFYDLTPDKIIDAVESLGVRCTGRVCQLNSMENRVYEVELDIDDALKVKKASERFRIIKFYRPGRWTKEQIKEEHEFLLDLQAYEIPVIAPIPFESGETLIQVSDTGILAAVFPKAVGKNPEELNSFHIPQIGRLLARMHNVGATKLAKHRIKIDSETYGHVNINYLTDKNIIPKQYEKRFVEAASAICDISQPWFEQAEVQRIHGDCHLGNLLWGEEGAFLVDFDDMLEGPPVQDIWLVTPGRDDFTFKHREQLLEAYEQMRSFDYLSLRLIEPLRALRFIHFNAWIARRFDDPAFQRTFVNFGTDKYWEEQVAMLDEQLEVIGKYS